MSESSAIRLRRTSDDDFAALRALFDHPSFYGWGGSGRLCDDHLRSKYLGRRYPEVECFLVVHGDQAVGLAQIHAAGEAGGGMDLILLPEARGRGFGRAVVADVVRRAREERGWSRLTVDPDLGNEEGVKFWQAVGFTPERVVTDVPGRSPHLVMAWAATSL